MVKAAITKFEVQMTTEIREERDSGGKKMWKYISKLRGIEQKQANIAVFDQNDTLILKEELPDRVMEGWRSIYQMHNGKSRNILDSREQSTIYCSGICG